jgi:putative phosphoribosyl transferase
MIFKDREEAGLKLADALIAYRDDKDAVVLGLPRGGVVLAAAVAKKLHLPLDVICPRKIGAPFHKEFAIGAITETGQLVADVTTMRGLEISGEYLKREIEYEKEQAQRRLSLFRQGKPPRDLKDKITILVDDGLATGMTMKAAIQTAKEEGSLKVVVAVPVAPRETVSEIEALVDEIYCLSTPAFFQAVGQFYQNFTQVEDGEVLDLMNTYSL